jgi:succinoglycan biosynthesis protein ExoO
MTSAPTVSVVTANFNGAAHLAEALQSVQRQTMASWELIVVDDASCDDSVEIARRLAEADTRIRILTQPENRGPAAARNRALDEASGDWIAVFDSDDVMLPDRLQRLLVRARQDGALVIADNQTICSADLAPQSQFIDDHCAAELREVDLAGFIDSSRLYARRPDLGFLKPLIERRLIARSGARYDESLRIGEDFHFLVSVLATGATLHIEPEPLYLYRKHGSSISHRLSPAVIESMIRADRHVRAELHGHPAAVRAMSRRIEGLKSWATHEQVMDAAKRGRWGEALSAAAIRPHAWPLMSRPLRDRLSAAVVARQARSAIGVSAGGEI